MITPPNTVPVAKRLVEILCSSPNWIYDFIVTTHILLEQVMWRAQTPPSPHLVQWPIHGKE
jgi:hypothetical protein